MGSQSAGDVQRSAATATAARSAGSGSRIISKGIGPNPERVKISKHLLIRGHLDSGVGAYQSVLGFDLASLPFTPDPKIPATNPVDAEKSKLNEQFLAAAYQNDAEAAQKALDAGANVNAADAYGNTVLMLAAEASVGSGKDKLIELLLERGGDAGIRDPGGLTALEHAYLPLVTVSGAWNPRAIRTLKKTQKEAR
jgi:hypothetical protein